MVAADSPEVEAGRQPLVNQSDDLVNPEQANVRRLIRWVAMFIAWPSLSIGLAFLIFTNPSEHWLHIAGLLPLGMAACVLFALAPRLAERWVPG